MGILEKLLVLGGSLGSCEMISYARSRGVYVIVTDYLEASTAKAIADECWDVSTADIDELELRCRQGGIGAVIGGGCSEFNLERAMDLCERLGLPSYCTREAWSYSRDKRKFKELCKRVGAPVATDYAVGTDPSDAELDAVEFPVVVKPLDLCANRGVSYCYTKDELVDACRYARSLSASDDVIVEKMLRGGEWYAFYAFAEGEASLVAFNATYSQPGRPKNCYSVNTTATEHVRRFVEEVNPKVVELLGAVGCREGVAWVQVMLDDGDFYLVEMAHRLGADMIWVPYREMRGFDSVAWLVDYALGRGHRASELPAPQTEAFAACGCTYMLWTDRAGHLGSVEGLDHLRTDPRVQAIDFRLNPGDEFRAYESLGNVMFATADCSALCDVIAAVNERVRLIDDNGDDVLVRFDDFASIQGAYARGLAE